MWFVLIHSYSNALFQASQEKRKVIFEKTAAYEKEYYEAERSIIEKKRAAKADGSLYVPPEPKLIFVVRIKGINKIAPKPRKALQLLRLLQINNGVFLRVTKATKELLRLVEPYVAYGYPNEIYTVGPNFKQANNFLWPFKLSNPTGGWGVRRKFKHFIEGGAIGDREENINQLVDAMN